ncbi:MAG: endolytic transglycosylase MltG, partial [Anaerolineales bacterium]|nr:endolytic transglycosylase MltG [Anaerolineales bacterium]
MNSKKEKRGKVGLLILFLGLTMLMLVGTGCSGLSQGEGDVAEVLGDLLLRVYLAFHRGDISKTASDDPTPVVFVVEPGDTAGDIALRLKRWGLITDAELFRQLAQYEKADGKLEAGRYELRANMTMGEIIEALQHGRLEEIAVTIPEGWRVEQIAEMLTEEMGVNGDEFLELVKGGPFDYEFLQGRPPDATLEGFLFPDTYLLPGQPPALDI